MIDQNLHRVGAAFRLGMLAVSLYIAVIGLGGFPVAIASTIELRTHDGREPFSQFGLMPGAVKVSQETRSWRTGEIAPFVGIQSRALDYAISKNERMGTGFIVGKFQEANSRGVLILTDYHVLVADAWAFQQKPGPSLKVQFFTQKPDPDTGADCRRTATLDAEVAGVAVDSDLALLRVGVTAQQFEQIILPPLYVGAIRDFKGHSWRTETVRVNPAPGETSSQACQVLQQKAYSTARTTDVVNSLAMGTNAFYYLSGQFQQGMSGGPLVAREVLSKEGQPLKEYEDVLFGPLGYIFDISTFDGYAYPLQKRFLELLGGGLGKSIYLPGLAQKVDTPLEIEIENSGKRELIKFEKAEISLTIFKRAPTPNMPIIQDMAYVSVRETNPNVSGSTQLSITQSVHYEVSQGGGTSGVGSGGGSTGTGGGSTGTGGGTTGTGGGTTGTGGGTTGTGGGSGSGGGTTGTGGSGGSQGLPLTITPIYWVSLYSYSSQTSNNTTDLLAGGSVGETPRPMSHIKDVYMMLSKGGKIQFQVGKYGTKVKQHFENIDEILKVIRAKTQVRLQMNPLLAALPDSGLLGPFKLNESDRSEGEWKVVTSPSAALTGWVNFNFRSATSGQSYNLKLTLGLRQNPATQAWELLVQKFSLDGKTLSLKTGAKLEATPVWLGPDRVVIQLSLDGKNLGEVEI